MRALLLALSLLGTAAAEELILQRELGAQNVLANSSFETGDTAWLLWAPGDIHTKTVQGDRRSRCVRDFVRDAHAGKWSIRVDDTVAAMQEFSLVGLRCNEVAIALWAKADKGASGEAALWAGDGARLGALTFTAGEEFEAFSKDIAIPKDVAEPLKVVVRGLKGSILVDEVQVLALAESGKTGAAAAIDDLTDMEAKAAAEFRDKMQALKDEKWAKRNAKLGSPDETLPRELYCRVSVSKSAPGPLCLEMAAQTSSQIKIDLDGWPMATRKAVKFGWNAFWVGALPAVQSGPPGKDAQIRPGEQSPWIRVMPPILPDCRNAVTFKGRSGRLPAKAMDFTLELSLEANDKSPPFRRDCRKSGDLYIVLFPSRTPASKYAEAIFDEQHFADEARKAIDALGPPQYGRKPSLFQVGSNFSGSPGGMGKDLCRFWIQIFSDLGLNTIGIHGDGVEYALEAGLRLYQHAPVPGSARIEWLLNCNWEHFEEQCKAGWQKLLKSEHFDPGRVVTKSFGNETNSPPTSFIVRDTRAQEWFRRYLKESGFEPKDLGVKEWSEIRPCTRYEYVAAIARNKKYREGHGEFERMQETEKDDDKEIRETHAGEAKETFDEKYQPLPYDDLACAKLFFWTNRFRVHTMQSSYDKAASVIFKAKPADLELDVCTGYFSDGWMHEGGGNMFEEGVGSGNDLLNMLAGNSHCTSMAASNLIYWGQLHGWSTDILRSSGKGERFIPVHDGLVPSWRDPVTLEYTMFMKLAHGTKTLFYFPYGPYPYHILDGPLTGKPDFFEQIRRINYMLGDAEDLIVPATIPRAQVAFIYNQTADIWSLLKRKEDRGSFGAMGLYKAELNEKRGVWLALRHEHYACDILSDWDLAGGVLGHYKVAYLAGSAGPNIDRKGAEALRDWVKGGGTLWVDCHTGLRDEYDRPLAAMTELLGVTETKLELDPRTKAQRKGELHFGEIAGLGEQEPLWVVHKRSKVAVAQDAKVLARFSDGLPAVVEREYGKGRVFYTAAYPGLAYFRGKYPWIKWLGLGEEFPEQERAVITLGVKHAKPERWVVLSKPVIHWGYLASDKGICVPLLNFLYVPQDKVEASVKVAKGVAKVRSTVHGDLKFRQENGRVELSLPLDRCDFVCIYYE